MQTTEYDIATQEELNEVKNALKWSNGTTFGTSGYYKYNQYLIYVGLNGGSKSYTGGGWTTVGTLPSGYRPPRAYYGRTNRDGYYIKVASDGVLQVYNDNATATVSLTGSVLLPRTN